MTSINITHRTGRTWTSAPPSHSPTHMHSEAVHTSCVRQPLRPALFFAAIAVYALTFIVWYTCLDSAHGRGFAVLFPKGYDEHLKRMLALFTSKYQQKQVIAQVDVATAFECLGWRHTMDCDPHSHVLGSFNRSCDHSVRGGQSGYCALRDRVTGREVHTMRATCTTVPPDVLYTCADAIDFVRFQHEVRAVVTSAQTAAATTAMAVSDRKRNSDAASQQLRLRPHQLTRSQPTETRGIVMVVYPKLLVSAYASIRTLRESLNCSLPIELWYLEAEMSSGANTTASASFLQTLQRSFTSVTLHAIMADANVAGFTSKVWAIAHSHFDNVLFLDADNFPVKDPTFLFATPEFRRTGAVFWPDFWHPSHTIFNIHNASLLWELLDMDFVDMFEQESGQLLIDKRRSAGALQLLQLFAFRQPSLFDSLKLVHGDKDLFRLAWLKTDTSFHMVTRPPAIAGMLNETKFCGMTMAQYDPTGDAIVFLHRNARKLHGGRPAVGQDPEDARSWTHLQSFAYQTNASASLNATVSTTGNSVTRNATDDYARLKQFYNVAIYNGAPQFAPTQWCYGRETPARETHFRTEPWAATSVADVERDVLRFARAGAALLPAEDAAGNVTAALT